MTHTEWLLSRARNHWVKGHDLPRSLFSEMHMHGIDIDAERAHYLKEISNG